MGYDVQDLAEPASLTENLKCGICLQILEDPETLQPCQHLFCKKCIESASIVNGRKIRNLKCPIDRTQVTSRQEPERLIRNILEDLRFKCPHANRGCDKTDVRKLIAAHGKECVFNPEKQIVCEKGCASVIRQKDLADHNCLKRLRELLDTGNEERKKLRKEVTDLKVQNTAMTSLLSNRLNSIEQKVAVLEELHRTDSNDGTDSSSVTQNMAGSATPPHPSHDAESSNSGDDLDDSQLGIEIIE